MSGQNLSAKESLKKTDIALDIAGRFNKWALEKMIAPSICLIDGSYTNKKIIELILKSTTFKGFVGRFSKGRNITINNFSGLLKTYINSLVLNKDFKPYEVHGKEKLVHEAKASLDYGPAFKLVIILDDPGDIKSARPLITNMIDISAAKIAEYYALRWKEETYHQAIKDAFFARTHKFRRLKTFSRYLEIINIAYGLCEQRRWAKYGGTMTIFEVKNELLRIAKEEFILNLKGRKLAKQRREAILARYRT
jgi:hypothetical protein